MIRYKNYLIEQESSYYNLYKEVDYEKRDGFGRNAATTGEIATKQNCMGYGMPLERALEKINKDQLIDFDGELKDYIKEYNTLNKEIIEYFKSNGL
jgi:hypothetical protein